MKKIPKEDRSVMAERAYFYMLSAFHLRDNRGKDIIQGAPPRVHQHQATLTTDQTWSE